MCSSRLSSTQRSRLQVCSYNVNIPFAKLSYCQVYNMQKKSVAFTVFDALAVWFAYCDSDHRCIAGLFYIIYLHNMLTVIQIIDALQVSSTLFTCTTCLLVANAYYRPVTHTVSTWTWCEHLPRHGTNWRLARDTKVVRLKPD